MAERHQHANTQDNNSSAASDSGHPQIGMDAGEHKNAQLVDKKFTTQEVAEPKRTTNSGAQGATETTTATTHAD